MGFVDVLGEDGGSQAIHGVIGTLYHFLQILKLQYLHDWTKDLQGP